MIREIIIAITITSSLMAMGQNGNKQIITGSKNVITETRDMKGISSVLVRGSGMVEFIQGDKEEVRVTGDDNVIPFVLTELKEGKLTIQKKEKVKMKKISKISIAIVVKDLKELEVHGSADIRSDGFLSTGDLSIVSQGSSDIDLNLKSSNITVNSNGSGDIRLLGTASKLTLKSFGSGDVKAYDLQLQEADVNTKGSGNVQVAPMSTLSVNMAGSGDVFYKGSPVVSKGEMIGSGQLQKEY